jgi:hypothetical protein
MRSLEIRKRAGENGPPRGPEKAMLLEGVTINDGWDGLAELSSAPVGVNHANSSTAGMPSKVIEGIKPAAMRVIELWATVAARVNEWVSELRGAPDGPLFGAWCF